ncbi:MMPL family transporter [Janibacter sp. GS2]|uniref:MMPL family transporter n=1 Tax=Janibacter sp. GS2 TaxID=3442646 RepID=UPI003EB9DBD4
MSRPRPSATVLRVLAGVAVLVWFVLAGVGGPLVGQLSSVQNNDQASFLPQDAESTQVTQRLSDFDADATLPLLIVVEDTDGLDPAVLKELGSYAKGLPEASLTSAPGTLGDYLAEPRIPVIPAEDGQAAMLVVSLDAAAVEKTVDESAVSDLIVEDLRGDLAPDVDATVAVTGPAGFTADLVKAFAGIDGLLLGVTLGVVLVILLVVYRSPILPFVVLLTSIFGLALAALLIYPMASAEWIQLSGQSQGILFILVVGAATDYSLLLVARYREELHERDPLPALTVAWRQTLGPVAASGGTVIAGLLCLLLSDLGNISGLGPIGALGIVGAMVSALTLLPAALALLGRVAFWPSVPKRGTAPQHRFWGSVAERVTARPRLTWLVTSGVLLIAAAGALTFNSSGITQAEFFTTEVESVDGQDVVDRHFDGGDQRPVQVIAPSSVVTDAKGVLSDSADVTGTVKETASTTGADSTLLTATLAVGSESQEARDVVRDLRTDLHAVDPTIRVGGATATTVDTDDASERDLRVVIPSILLVVTLILMALLRSVAASVILVAVNLLTFAATLGISAVLFNHVLGYPGADPSTPVLGFVFLVALAVDYSIFLMTRAREESLQVGTRRGIRRAVAVTGGVITSAGVVLAATFSALAVIPLLFLAQIAFIVAFGVLLDTIVTRSILVPAIAADLGNRIWWPRADRMAADAARVDVERSRAGRHRA